MLMTEDTNLREGDLNEQEGEDRDLLPTSLESYCVSCGDNGTTNFLRKTIPFFRDVILAAFSCDHCGFRSSELQSVSYEERGIHIETYVSDPKDLDREIIRTEYATINIPEIEFELPYNPGRKGEINTIEGIISTIVETLEHDQPLRKIQLPEQYEKINVFVEKVKNLLDRKTPFTFIIDDPSGNSFIQNPYAPDKDPRSKRTTYVRTKEQRILLGLPEGAFGEEDGEDNSNEKDEKKVEHQKSDDNGMKKDKNEKETKKTQIGFPNAGRKGQTIVDPSSFNLLESFAMSVTSPEDIVEFSVPCSMCQNKDSKMRMVSARIPLFKEIVLMAFSCDLCGYKDSEVKSGGSISPLGKKYILKVSKQEDLRRDVLKSDTANLVIPEIHFEITPGSLGGVFTTIEGIIMKAKQELSFGAFTGDSGAKEDKSTMGLFLNVLDDFAHLKSGPFTLEIDDPLANSYIQDLRYPLKDESLSIQEYVRSTEQEEELGLEDMVVEGYEEKKEEEEGGKRKVKEEDTGNDSVDVGGDNKG